MKTPKIGGRYVRLANGEVVPRDKAPAQKPKKNTQSNNTSAESAGTGNKADSDTPKEAD